MNNIAHAVDVMKEDNSDITCVNIYRCQLLRYMWKAFDHKHA